MPVFDIKYDTTPQNRFGKPRGPKISDMKTALSTYSATSYTTERMNQMTKNDLVSACNIHGLTVAGV